MGTPNKQNNLLVKSPKYSIFDISSDHKLTYSLGRIVPFNGCGYEMMPGDEIDVNVQHLTRFLPMLSPVMQRYVLDFVPCFVPYRLLWSEDYPIWNSNKFFNPATPDTDRPAILMTSWRQLFSNLDNKVFGSLFDYLGYPTLTGLYDVMLNASVTYSGDSDELGFDSLFNFEDNSTPKTWSVKVTYLGVTKTLSASGSETPNTSFLRFKDWLKTYKNAPQFSEATSWDEYIPTIPGSYKYPQLVDEYINYMFVQFSGQYLTANATKDLSLLPWLCYHKAVSDWFIRTDMIDPDSYMAELKNISMYLFTTNTVLKDFTGTTAYSLLIRSGSCVPRLWMDDYFTTAMTSLQSGANVAIPVNGTIQQLWTANRLEQFRMRIQLAGKRFIDQIYQLFGVKVPDARLQRTEILGHVKFNIAVSDILQTSQSDIDSSLGSFAGQGMSTGSRHLCHYKADEPGLLLILGSVRPTTSYVEHTNRLIFKKDYYDFANPMFDNVGVQAIMNNELCYRPGDNSVFGYSPRRYAEYMTGHSSIHGQFKTSLDYWHAGRKFDLSTSVPALNPAFISMDDADGLDRIFASQSGDNILSQVYFDTKVTRPLSRYVNYHM